jgi:hypothetical protein
VPLPSVDGSVDHVLPEDETIHTAFIGLGHYGQMVGQSLSKIWKSKNPIILYCTRGVLKNNCLIKLNYTLLNTFQGYGYELDTHFSKIWKKHSGSIQALDSVIDHDYLQDILQGKELIFLACDEMNEVWKVARSAALAVEPFLSITLQPTLTSKPQQHALLSNESILLTTPLDAFPQNWDPVSTIFGSLVNPGLIGIDPMDLKSVVRGRNKTLNTMEFDQEIDSEELQNRLQRTFKSKERDVYAMIQGIRLETVTVEWIDRIAGTIVDAMDPSSIYFTVGEGSQYLPGPAITLIT